jgi:hypothetical protein
MAHNFESFVRRTRLAQHGLQIENVSGGIAARQVHRQV